nr:Na+/H+ antiporter subunit E [Micromonospora sp. DSM 115978]
MSRTSAPPPRLPSSRHRLRDQLLTVGWLVLVWNLLWGEFSVGNLVGGVLVAVFILVFFPLPSVTFGGRFRPVGVVRFLTWFLSDLVVASVQVAGIALRPGYVPRSAIIGVRLRIRSDLNLTLTAEALSLVPGSLIIEADRENATLYVHVLDVRGPADVTAARRKVLDLEARIVRAVGSDAELRMLAADPAGTAGPADPPSPPSEGGNR